MLLRIKTILFSLFCTLVFCKTYSINLPEIEATGNQFYCGESPMPIVIDVNITNGNGSLDVVYIQISTGYNFGADVLFLDGVFSNITASWSIGEGLLTLTGPASFTDFEDAIRAVKFSSIQNNFTEDRFFSINLGDANFLPSTGHYYLYVEDVGITWEQAKTAAASQTYFGLQGYLATITTQEEAQITGEQSSGTGWIGGSDQQSEGTWIWETGPEIGQVFWEGLADGNAPNGAFAFWNTGEPNDFGGEDYAHITDPSIGVLGSWNDLPVQGDGEPNSPYHPQGYVIEFGGMDGDPNISASASTVIITPKVEITTYSICDNGLAEISVITNTDDVFWYGTINSTAIINTGNTYQNTISTTTTYWVLPVFNGCTSGTRLPITVNVYESPIANDITIMQCDDEVADGISSFNLNNYTDNIIISPSGQVDTDLEVRFFEDNQLTNEIDTTSYINTINNQIIYAGVFDELTGCFSKSEITLQVNSSDGIIYNLEACDDLAVDGITFFNLPEVGGQILSNAPINASVAYFVSYNDALLGTNEIFGDEYINEVAYNDTIYARVDIDNSCYAINQVNLIVKGIPNVNQYEEVYYCLNNFPETITLEGGIIDDIPNNYYYNWSTGETTMNIDVNETGTYEVLVTKPFGCTNQRTIVVLSSSSANIQSIEVTDLSENNTISIFVSGDGDYVYALDDENGMYQDSNTFENVPAGVHTIYVKDIKANCGIVSEDVSVLGFPKFFTPNEDTVNDTWQIKGFSSEFDTTMNVEIFNRYGKLITILNANNPKWDGTYNGELLPRDDYWFVARLLDGRTHRGHFTLKR